MKFAFQFWKKKTGSFHKYWIGVHLLLAVLGRGLSSCLSWPKVCGKQVRLKDDAPEHLPHTDLQGLGLVPLVYKCPFLGRSHPPSPVHSPISKLFIVCHHLGCAVIYRVNSSCLAGHRSLSEVGQRTQPALCCLGLLKEEAGCISKSWC